MNKDRVFIPTGTALRPVSIAECVHAQIVGFQSKELIVKGGLGLGDVDQYPIIDVTIDGADE